MNPKFRSKTNYYAKNQSKLNKYHKKMTNKNFKIIVGSVVVLVSIMGFGIWHYSQATNNHSVSAPRELQSSLSSTERAKTIPRRLCGTYTYNLTNNKYYHINLLWHLTPNHIYQQLVVMKNKIPSHNSLSQAQAKWRITKKAIHQKRAKESLQIQISHSQNVQQKRILIHKLHNLDKMQKKSQKSKVQAKNIPMAGQIQHPNNRMHNKKSKHIDKQKHNIPDQDIPLNVRKQMVHISSIAENYNESYNVKSVATSSNWMTLTLTMNTRIVSKLNNQLRPYINVKQMHDLTPKIGSNKFKLSGNNLEYKGQSFELVPSSEGKHVMSGNNFTRYWAGY